MGLFSLFKPKEKETTDNSQATGRDNIVSLLKAAEKNAIEFTKRELSETISIGASKIGGKPHLPEGFSWPYYEGTNFDNIKASRPLSFIAQINLSEVATLDVDNKLPHSGFLYFFYELNTMKWGFAPEDNGCARVFYCDNAANQLSATDYPFDLNSDYYVPECPIAFSRARSFPQFEEFGDTIQVTWDDYEYAAKANNIDIEHSTKNLFKLLGYANLIQGSILWECAMIESGYTSDDWKTMSENSKKEIYAKESKWMLLAQFDTISDSIMFGDHGQIYFYIQKEDLNKGCFDNVHLSLQCY